MIRRNALASILVPLMAMVTGMAMPRPRRRNRRKSVYRVCVTNSSIRLEEFRWEESDYKGHKLGPAICCTLRLDIDRERGGYRLEEWGDCDPDAFLAAVPRDMIFKTDTSEEWKRMGDDAECELGPCPENPGRGKDLDHLLAEFHRIIAED